MENIPSYINRKHGLEEPDYLYPTLEPILKETYGIIIYQEQVMQIAQELSGYSLGAADLLRRAMGKKNKAEMAAQRVAFVDGAKARGVEEKKASEIRSEEHTSELQSLMRISYAVFCLKKKKQKSEITI